MDVCGTGNFELKNTFSVNEINKLISTNSSKISFGEVILKSLLPALSEQERGLVIDYMEKHSTEPKDDTNVRVWLRRFKRSKSNATELKPKRVYKTKKRISVEKVLNSIDINLIHFHRKMKLKSP